MLNRRRENSENSGNGAVRKMHKSTLLNRLVGLTIQSGYRAAILVLGAMSASCTMLDPNVAPCVSTQGLTASEIQALTSRGSPVLSVGPAIVMCACYDIQQQRRKNAAGGTDRDDMVGAGESGHLDGNNESGELDGSGETGTLAGNWDTGSLAGQSEAGSLVGSDESGVLAGDEESGALVGAGEQNSLVGAEESGLLDGRFENGELDGQWSRDATLTCLIDNDCPGYRLVGLSVDTVDIISADGARSASEACITW